MEGLRLGEAQGLCALIASVTTLRTGKWCADLGIWAVAEGMRVDCAINLFILARIIFDDVEMIDTLDVACPTILRFDCVV